MKDGTAPPDLAARLLHVTIWGIEVESIFCRKLHSGMESRRTLRRRAFQARLGGETCVCFDSGTEGNSYVCSYAFHSKLPRETARPRPQFSPEVASNRAGLFGAVIKARFDQ
jgi:hypothetical protein